MLMRTHVRGSAFLLGYGGDMPTNPGLEARPAEPFDPRSVLVAERARSERLLADVERSMQDVSDAREGSNSDDEHDPEGATLAWERGSLGAVRNDAQRRIEQVDRALERLESGTYGLCAEDGEPIPEARLRVVPWATTCVQHAG
jgi:RNA polymerase-binding transcription factor DksA